jgi:Ca2+-binding EF-hand superfamily protein
VEKVRLVLPHGVLHVAEACKPVLDEVVECFECLCRGDGEIEVKELARVLSEAGFDIESLGA